MSADTSRERVEMIAANADYNDWPQTAATLRALLAERDAAKRTAREWQTAAHTAGTYREAERMRAEHAEAERDAARADAVRLRGAVEALIAADDHWLKGDKGGEWAHRMSIAREVAKAALAGGKHE